MGRKPILTRKQILDYFDKRMAEKGLENGVRKGGDLFRWYMESPVRPTTQELSEVFQLERNWMAKLRKRYEQDLQ